MFYTAFRQNFYTKETVMGKNIFIKTYLLTGILAIASGCGPTFKVNPEYNLCFNNCMTEKNSCIVDASDSVSISTCDNAHNECVDPCIQIPKYIKIEKE